jgi:hypothetical protein
MFEHMPNARIVDTVLPIAQNLFRAHGSNRNSVLIILFNSFF